jgi:hypothetical protein
MFFQLGENPVPILDKAAGGRRPRAHHLKQKRDRSCPPLLAAFVDQFALREGEFRYLSGSYSEDDAALGCKLSDRDFSFAVVSFV